MAWVWRWFYQPAPIGVFNGWLTALGFAQQPFLRSTTQALPAVLSSVVTIVLWKRFYDPTERGVLNVIVMHVPAVAYLILGALCLWVCVNFAGRLWVQDSRLASAAFAAAGIGLLLLAVDWARPILLPPGGSWSGAASRLFSVPSQPYRWLSDPSLAMVACVIPMVWAGVGPGCLIYLAALKGVSNEYYEAAEIDGAGFVDKVLFVVLPVLRPLILINFIGVFIGSWYGAESNILAMTGGAANTEVAGLHIFYKAFQALQFGPATAMAWVLAFMLIGFTAYQLRLISGLEFRSAGGAK
jgi:multiple sugar transport system permease protein